MLTGTGSGVDVLSERGEPMVRVQTNYTAHNFVWVGDELRELWVILGGGSSTTVTAPVKGRKR